jgi:hypothetical protein
MLFTYLKVQFPRIPLFQTGPAYWEMRELLAQCGVPDDRPDALPTASAAVAK